MPIKPENRHHYRGQAWKDTRAAILERAGNRCELCYLANGETVYRDGYGFPHRVMPPGACLNAVRVVLTIAHINQNPADNRVSNLLALCQRCHLQLDRPYSQEKAAATRSAKKAQVKP